MKSKIVIALTIFAFVSCGKKTGGNTGAPEYVVETVTTTSTEQSTSPAPPAWARRAKA